MPCFQYCLFQPLLKVGYPFVQVEVQWWDVGFRFEVPDGRGLISAGHDPQASVLSFGECLSDAFRPAPRYRRGVEA